MGFGGYAIIVQNTTHSLYYMMKMATSFLLHHHHQYFKRKLFIYIYKSLLHCNLQVKNMLENKLILTRE